MKAYVGVDAEPGLVHMVISAAANRNDLTRAMQLLHVQEADVFANARCQAEGECEEVRGLVADWHIVMRPGKHATVDPSSALAAKTERVEKIMASIRAKTDPAAVWLCQALYRKNAAAADVRAG